MADEMPVLDPFSRRNFDQEIQDAVANLRPLGFPVNTWTESSILSFPLRSCTWLKSVRIVVSITDADALSRILNLGISRGFWIEHASCTSRQFYDFCIWLRSPDGVKARDDMYFLRRMEKKKRKRIPTTPEESEKQFAEEKRHVRLQYEARIDELQIQIRKVEEQIQKCDDSDLSDSAQRKREIQQQHEERIDELQLKIQKLRQEQEEQIQELHKEEEKIKKWHKESAFYRALFLKYQWDD